jgi:hypothetical protein
LPSFFVGFILPYSASQSVGKISGESQMSKPRTGTVFWSKRYKRYVAKMSATHPVTGKIRQWERHAETSKEAHARLKEI